MKKLASAFGKGLRRARLARHLVQEDFGIPSSRTYVSLLERGKRIPTLGKIADLSDTLGVHPVTLTSLAFVTDVSEAKALLQTVERELLALFGEGHKR